MTYLYDAVIVGGGPAGSRTAYMLAKAGFSVAMLEQKSRSTGPVCCTGIISQECIDLFSIPENLILRKLNSALLFSPSGKSIRLHRKETQACVIDRAAFNQTMINRAEEAGASVFLANRVTDINIKTDRVEVECQGDQAELQTRAIVVATGLDSKLPGKLEPGKVTEFTFGAQVAVKTSLEEVEFYSGHEIAPASFGWLVPTLPQRALVGLLSQEKPAFYLKRLTSNLLARGKILSCDKPLYRRVPLKPPVRTYGNRLLIVGDAAGHVKPTTGGGIYFSLLCADIAASTLTAALNTENLTAHNLAIYQRRWQSKLGQELTIGYWARKLYESLADEQIDWIFDIIKSNGIDCELLKAREVSFDWHSKVILTLLRHRTVSSLAYFMPKIRATALQRSPK